MNNKREDENAMGRKLLVLFMILSMTVMMLLPTLADAPAIKEIDYEGNGIVEVEFRTENVAYKKPKVVVKNPKGQKMSVSILEKDDDSIRFKVKKVKAGTKYTFTISGIRTGQSGTFSTISGSFKTPSDKLKIKKITYDAEDKEIEVDFSTKVTYKKLKVTVKDSGGKKLAVKRINKDDDELDIRVNGIQSGQKYTVTISGVSVQGADKYVKITKTFTAK